jgi:hypothetical protein
MSSREIYCVNAAGKPFVIGAARVTQLPPAGLSDDLIDADPTGKGSNVGVIKSAAAIGIEDCGVSTPVDDDVAIGDGNSGGAPTLVALSGPTTLVTALRPVVAGDWMLRSALPPPPQPAAVIAIISAKAAPMCAKLEVSKGCM